MNNGKIPTRCSGHYTHCRLFTMFAVMGLPVTVGALCGVATQTSCDREVTESVCLHIASPRTTWFSHPNCCCEQHVVHHDAPCLMKFQRYHTSAYRSVTGFRPTSILSFPSSHHWIWSFPYVPVLQAAGLKLNHTSAPTWSTSWSPLWCARSRNVLSWLTNLCVESRDVLCLCREKLCKC